MSGKDKVALVTGASSGLGRATAAVLKERGYRVYGTSRDPARTPGLGWPLLSLDVCSDASVAACVAEITAREGRIDILVNNAGHAFVGAVEETSLDDAHAQLETNFFGALRMMLAVLPLMRARLRSHCQCKLTRGRRSLSLPWRLRREQARARGDLRSARL